MPKRVKMDIIHDPSIFYSFIHHKYASTVCQSITKEKADKDSCPPKIDFLMGKWINTMKGASQVAQW